MNIGSQWTALWVRLADRKILCFDTIPWDFATGGYGATSCEPDSSEWLPGEYDVQVFVGIQWNNSGRFSITGDPPQPTITPTLTQTITPSPTLTLTPTRTMTLTPTRTLTPTLTRTRAPTATISPTITRWPTATNPPPTNTPAR
jgi:type VI secretion system secreted protein VgrG